MLPAGFSDVPLSSPIEPRPIWLSSWMIWLPKAPGNLIGCSPPGPNTGSCSGKIMLMMRLTEMGFDLGLVSQEALENLREKRRLIQEEEMKLSGKKLFPLPEINAALLDLGSSEIKEPLPFLKLLKRPELNLDILYKLGGESPTVSPAVIEQIEIKHKYEGYINRQLEAVKQFVNLEKKRLPADFDYDAVAGLSNEVRQKLKDIRPHSLGQAARISGVTPAAIAILLVYLKRGRVRMSMREN